VISRSNTSVCVAVMVCALCFTPRGAGGQRARAAHAPDGLPDWAFNIPDKEQPSAVRPEGIVRAPGSAREYEWAKVSGNTNPPDWFRRASAGTTVGRWRPRTNDLRAARAI